MSNLWISRVPKSWQVLSLGRVLSRNDGGVWGEDNLDEGGTKVLRSTEILQDGQWFIKEPAVRKLSSQEMRSGLLKSGDLLLTKSSGSKLHLGKVALVNNEIEREGYAYSNFIQRLRLKDKILPKFMFYVLNSKVTRSQINYWGLTTSGLVNLNGPAISRFIVPVPTISDQKKIAQFLDHKVAKIDEAIAKKKKLLELLEEKRKSTIYKMLQTIGGIGLKIGRVVRLVNGSTPSSDNPSFWEGDIKWITPIDLSHIGNSKYVFDSIRKITKDGYLSCGTTLVPKGSIILSTRAPIGLIAIAGDKVCTNQGCKSLVLNKEKVSSEFLYYFLINKKNELQSLGSGSTFLELSADSLKNIEIKIPDIHEQVEIVRKINDAVDKIDSAKTKISVSISSLEEYKTSLISNAVTGRVRV